MTSYLLDTHVLLWAATGSPNLSERAQRTLSDPGNELWFSVVTVWEIVIKTGLGRSDLRVEPNAIRDRAIRAGYRELPIRGSHALAVAALPPIHADPFDRMLLAQARTEGMPLLTADRKILRYGAGVVGV